jgi:PAS domain S-box-containing protein
MRRRPFPGYFRNDQESRRFYGVKSSVVLPLSVGSGPLIGTISFDTFKEERDWSDEIVKRLMLVAQIFTNALARKESERILLESEARLSLAANSAKAGLWELNCSNNLFWATERAFAIFGYDAGEVISMERFEQSVYHDDIELVRQAIAQSLKRGIPISIEYRILTDDGSMKWIHSSGQPYFKPNGEPDRLLGVSIEITERKLMEETLRKNTTILRNNQKDLQRLAGKLITAKEEELRMLARELHDDLTQRLAVLAIEVGKLELQMNKMEQPLPDLTQKLSEIREQLIEISKDTHHISRQLHPTILDDLGLVQAIKAEYFTLQQRQDLKIDFRKEDFPDKLPNDISLCLYRIVQEGLRNIISHAQTKKCEIFLKSTDSTVYLTVKDKGVGFDFAEVRHKLGIGLSSMRERVLLVEGNFSVDSQPGRGTTINFNIPLKKDGT